MATIGHAALDGSLSAIESTLRNPQTMHKTIVGLSKTVRIIASNKPIRQAISSPAFLTLVFQSLKPFLPTLVTPGAVLSVLALATSYRPRFMLNAIRNVSCFTLRAFKYIAGPDNVEREATNLQDLQDANKATSTHIENLPELLHLLSALFQFVPALQAAEKQVDNIQQASELYLKHIQEEIQTHQQINPHQVDSAIFYFMAELEHMLSVHGENISILPRIIEELKDTEKRLEKAHEHLKASKKEMQETVEDLKSLNVLILEAGLEQDQALKDLLFQANEWVQKSLSISPLIKSGAPNGITLES